MKRISFEEHKTRLLTFYKFNRGLGADIQLFISYRPRWFRTVKLTEIRA